MSNMKKKILIITKLALLRLDNLNKMNNQIFKVFKIKRVINPNPNLLHNSLTNDLNNNLGNLNGQLIANKLPLNNGLIFSNLNGLNGINSFNTKGLDLNDGYKFSIIGSHLTGLNSLQGQMGMILGGNEQLQTQPQMSQMPPMSQMPQMPQMPQLQQLQAQPQQQQPQQAPLGFTDQLNYSQMPIPLPQSSPYNTPTLNDYRSVISKPAKAFLAPGLLNLPPLPQIANLPPAPIAQKESAFSSLTANLANSRLNAGLLPAQTFNPNGILASDLTQNTNTNRMPSLPNLPQLNSNNLGNGMNNDLNGLNNNDLGNGLNRLNNGYNGFNDNLGLATDNR